jgi:hypothetical protein
MSTARPFAYNTGSNINGTEQIGALAIGIPSDGFGGNPDFWNGPDEDLGYVIAYPAPLNNHPTPVPDDALTLSSTYKGVDINLSNNNQTASQQFGYQMSVLTQTLISGSDKVMFSVRSTSGEPSTLPQNRFIGVGKTTMNYQGNPYGGYPGNDDKSIGFNAIGEFYFMGSVISSGLPTWTQGDIIDIAISHGQDWWIRVNGGNWNNNSSANPTTLNGGLAIYGLSDYYPALCPGYEGTMTVLNNPIYGVPTGYDFLGNVAASVGFWRSKFLTNESFLELVLNKTGQTFATMIQAKTWLNNNGYWTSYTGFGSSGFQWMNISSITSTTASGSGQNGITVAITQSNGGMGTENGMYSPTTFPPEYGVPLSGDQIRNTSNGVFTATFSQPVVNPLVAFASVGRPDLSVPVQVSAPFTPIWSLATTFQNAVNGTQYTQFTGNEGFNIIRIDGTLSSVSFTYTVTEFYCTVCFGFVDQNA